MSAHARSLARAEAPPRLWVIVMVARPQRDDQGLRDLLRTLREHRARRISSGVFLARDVEGIGEQLVAAADRIRSAGGQVIIADSRVVTPEAPGAADDAR